jgi:hypothetical protein
MADTTGAPWNLPYPEDTDLVRDGASDIEALAVATAAGLSAANTGIGSNVVQTVKTDTFSTTSSTYVQVTGLSVTITPTSATSKVLLLAAVSTGHTLAVGAFAAIRINGGNATNLVGDAEGSRTQMLLGHGGSSVNDFSRNPFSHTVAVIDSPATTSAITYAVQIRTNFGTVFVNRGSSDSDSAVSLRGSSTLIAIEVAA